MKVFKVIILVFLGIFLCLSLLVFGLVLTLNQSVLNPDFIAEHVEKLDIAALADEIVTDNIPPEAAAFMGESLDEVLGDTIADIEPMYLDDPEALAAGGSTWSAGNTNAKGDPTGGSTERRCAVYLPRRSDSPRSAAASIAAIED